MCQVRKLEILLKFLGSYQSCYVLITVFMFLSEEHIANVLMMVIKNKLKSSTPTKHQVSINLDQNSIRKFHLLLKMYGEDYSWVMVPGFPSEPTVSHENYKIPFSVGILKQQQK